MMPQIDPEVQKEVLKKALDEWLDKKWAEFGWFSFKALAAFAFCGLVYFWFTSHGWKV